MSEDHPYQWPCQFLHLFRDKSDGLEGLEHNDFVCIFEQRDENSREMLLSSQIGFKGQEGVAKDVLVDGSDRVFGVRGSV